MTKPNNNLATINAIKALSIEHVAKVYSGKPGCMCGCNGNYRYLSAEYFQRFGPGYGTAEEEVNPQQVKKLLHLIQDNAKEVAIDRWTCGKEAGCLSFDKGYYEHHRYSGTRFVPTHSYVIYLTAEAMATIPMVTEVDTANTIEQ